jgi:hypothetical protein
MMLIFRKISILSFIFAFLFFYAIPAMALTPIEDGDLNFKLGDTSIYIICTVGDGDTLTNIPLQVWYEEAAPMQDIHEIRAAIIFNSGKLFFYDAVKAAAWPGDLSHSVSGDTLFITLDNGTVSPQLSPTTYANLQFTAWCGVPSTVDMDLKQGENYTYIFLNSRHYPPQGNLDDGSVTVIDNYNETYSIHDTTITGGALQTKIHIPVYVRTNYRFWGTYTYFRFDTTYLQYDSFYVADQNEYYMIKDCTRNKDTLKVRVYEYLNIFHDEYSSETKLYTLVFQVKNAAQGNTAHIDFIGDSSWSVPFDGFSGCFDVRQMDTLKNGDITIPAYADTAKLEFHCSTCDSMVGLNDDDCSAMIKMKNNFAAGDVTKSITLNYNTTNYLTVTDVDAADAQALDFDYASYSSGGTKQASVRQLYNANLTNHVHAVTDYADLAKMTFDFNDGSYSPSSYANRYLKVAFKGKYDDNNDLSQVWDTLNVVRCDTTNSKLINGGNDSVEIRMGEINLPGTSGTCHVHQEVKLRNNFSLDHFGFTVTIPAGAEIRTIDTGYTAGIRYTKISGTQYRIYGNSSTGFNGISPNGNNYTKVAEVMIRYCSRYGSVSGTPTISNDTMISSSSRQYVNRDPHSITIYGCLCNIDKLNEFASEEEAGPALPTDFKLNQNHPNPFNPETIISYDVPTLTRVKIVVMNILGQVVATLVDEPKSPGRYEIVWRGTDSYGARVSSGIYLTVMQAGNYSGTVKMSLMK